MAVNRDVNVEQNYPIERDAIFLRYDDGTVKLAYDALKDGYAGGGVINSRTVSRSIYDARALVTGGLAHGWRDWNGTILSYATNDDGLTREALGMNIEVGTTSELIDALLADDLEMLSVEDATWWPAIWIGPITPVLEFDPYGQALVLTGRFVQREATYSWVY